MGTLYIIATPIGNLKDITLRALDVLREVDLVVCEDTRQTIKLLNHFEIKKPLLSYFQHSRISRIEQIAENLRAGKNLALVTDAGTPGIADPGNKLIEQLLLICHSRESGNPDSGSRVKPGMTSDCELKIISIPGPCAAIAALSISGFLTDKFVFMGFPPAKKGREKYFKEVAEAKETVVFYESPHRILKTMEKLKELFSERPIVVCRELTKMFETIYRGKPEDILKKLVENQNNLKGEFVIVL